MLPGKKPVGSSDGTPLTGDGLHGPRTIRFSLRPLLAPLAAAGTLAVALGTVAFTGAPVSTANALPASPATTVSVCSTDTQGVFTFVDRSGYADDELSVSSSADSSKTYQYSLDRGSPVNILPGGVANVGANATRDFSLVTYVRNGDTVLSSYSFTVTNKECGTTSTTTAVPTTSTSTPKPTTTSTTTTTKPAEGTKTIQAKALDQTCGANRVAIGAHFVITQVKSEAAAPDTITVYTSYGVVVVNRTKFTGGVAHYEFTFATKGATISKATAFIYDSWSGQFNLSHLNCTDKPKPTTTTSVPPTTTSTTPPVTTTTSKPTTTSTTTSTTTTTQPPVTTSTSSQPSTTTTKSEPACVDHTVTYNPKTGKCEPVVIPSTSSNGGGATSHNSPQGDIDGGALASVSQTDSSAGNWLPYGLIGIVAFVALLLGAKPKAGGKYHA